MSLLIDSGRLSLCFVTERTSWGEGIYRFSTTEAQNMPFSIVNWAVPL